MELFVSERGNEGLRFNNYTYRLVEVNKRRSGSGKTSKSTEQQPNTNCFVRQGSFGFSRVIDSEEAQSQGHFETDASLVEQVPSNCFPECPSYVRIR
ncbi:hypothetical protein ElyMa_002683900 [Elysia marginata]|uniref:Uncharacterized protein n=1 Tax=Elysia marginata TaxID=1093978 RepID=A0AAV4HDH2_9GAST|nr:hypothetical protein ElyMa_002683900 [Elysia marginata]